MERRHILRPILRFTKSGTQSYKVGRKPKSESAALINLEDESELSRDFGRDCLVFLIEAVFLIFVQNDSNHKKVIKISVKTASLLKNKEIKS